MSKSTLALLRRRVGEYARAFAAAGCEEEGLTAVLAAVAAVGALRPGVLLFRQPA